MSILDDPSRCLYYSEEYPTTIFVFSDKDGSIPVPITVTEEELTMYAISRKITDVKELPWMAWRLQTAYLGLTKCVTDTI